MKSLYIIRVSDFSFFVFFVFLFLLILILILVENAKTNVFGDGGHLLTRWQWVYTIHKNYYYIMEQFWNWHEADGQIILMHL